MAGVRIKPWSGSAQSPTTLHYLCWEKQAEFKRHLTVESITLCARGHSTLTKHPLQISIGEKICSVPGKLQTWPLMYLEFPNLSFDGENCWNLHSTIAENGLEKHDVIQTARSWEPGDTWVHAVVLPWTTGVVRNRFAWGLSPVCWWQLLLALVHIHHEAVKVVLTRLSDVS